MTDFRLLRSGGFYHAVARYGNDVWTPFTYAGIHATEMVLRRKEQHRFWGVDGYSHEEGRYLRIGNRLFLAVCQFPAMRASWLAEAVKGSPAEVRRHLRRFVETGLVAVFDGCHYLSELGMRRTANMSRVRPAIIQSRHGAYLDRRYREHEQRHNDGVNRLVVQFAREGVDAVAGWRAEVNVPGLTQVRPDLLVPVHDGPFGEGPHFIEFELSAVRGQRVEGKLGPYRRMAGTGRPLPLLMVCRTAHAEENFREARRGCPC